MARYHINPKTGDPGLCRATKSCPFGDLASEHYASRGEAQEVYEAQNTAWPERIAWNRLSEDAQRTVQAGFERTRHRSGTPERRYWDAVLDNTRAGELLLERRLMEGAGDYQDRLKAAQELKDALPPPVEPAPLKEFVGAAFRDPSEVRDTSEKSSEELREQLAQYSALWMSRLTPEEISAVAWTTSNGGVVMRHHVEEGREPDLWGYDVYSTAYIEEQHKHLLTALAKAPKLREPTIIYRGTGSSHVEPYTDTGLTLPQSATVSLPVARRFTRGLPVGKGEGSTEEGTSTVLEIETRSIASPMCMSAWGGSEYEVFAPLGKYETVAEFEQIVGAVDRHSDRRDASWDLTRVLQVRHLA